MNPPKTMPPLYKVLVGGESKHFQISEKDLRHYHWSLPSKSEDGSWTPGAWHEVEGQVVLCHNGLHLTPDPLAWWLDGCVVYRAEAEGIVGDPEDTRVDPQGRKKVAAKRVRLLYPVDVTALLDARYTELVEREATWRRDAEEGRRRFEAETPLREAKEAAARKKAEADQVAWEKKQARWEAKLAAKRAVARAAEARVLALTPMQRSRERKKGTVVMSPVLQAATLFKASVPRGSQRRLNYGLYGVVKAAIESGMEFASSDVEDLFGLFHAAEWFSAEAVYGLAVKERHASACRAVEHYLGRKPWIVKGQRLAVRSEVWWEGQRCQVTSFNDRTDTLIVCSYKHVERGDYEYTELDERFKVTRDAFQKAFHSTTKARKESSKS